MKKNWVEGNANIRELVQQYKKYNGTQHGELKYYDPQNENENFFSVEGERE